MERGLEQLLALSSHVLKQPPFLNYLAIHSGRNCCMAYGSSKFASKARRCRRVCVRVIQLCRAQTVSADPSNLRFCRILTSFAANRHARLGPVVRQTNEIPSMAHQGGFIFPLFFAGASLGRALLSIAPAVLPPGVFAASPALMCMCFAAGLNVAVTRTPFASPLILATLSGQPNIMAPALCAALASLFVTRSSKFIGPQRDRADLHFIGDLQPLEEPSLQYAPPLSRSAVAAAAAAAAAAANGNGNVGAADEEKGALLDEFAPPNQYRSQFSFHNTLVSVEAPAPDFSVRSEVSFGGKELAAAAAAGAATAAAAAAEEKRAASEEDPESPVTASYRQGELIKMMVGGRHE